MGQRVLVTGAAGFLGSHLCERLIAEGDEVLGLDAFDATVYDAAPKEQNVEALSGEPRFRLVAGDVLEADLVADLARGQDVVIHLAALPGARASVAAPGPCARTNVEGTTNVLEACRAAGVRRVVFASSSAVYGARSDGRAFTEDDPCVTPASPYAASKRAAELVCSTYRDLHGIGVSVLRYFTVYGPRQRPDMAIHRFTAGLLAAQPITLFGETARDYVYIDDAIDGTVAACRRLVPGRFSVYNLGGTRTTGLRDLAYKIASAVGITTEVISGPPQPGDVPLTWADIARARDELGYTPKIALGEGLRRFVAWFRDQERA